MAMNKKGQVALEILVVISVIIIGMVLFGMFYLNQHSNQYSMSKSDSVLGAAQSVINYSDVTYPTRIVCGNFICESEEETCENCPSDCCTENCGNGNIDSGEECDSLNFGVQTCSSLIPGSSGNLSCNLDCTINTSGCVALPVCGNGIIEGAEQCDGEDLNSESCSSLNFDYGALSCNESCLFDTTQCEFWPASECLKFESGGWRPYNTTDPNWFTRGNMATWPDPSALWLCPSSDCHYIQDYYFLYNSFVLSETTNVIISALGDDETKVWLWPDHDISNEIVIIPKYVWINGWASDSRELLAGEYSIVQLIYDTNQSATGAILSVENSNTNEIILNTNLTSGWRYYSTMTQLEEERFSSNNGCSRVYSNQMCGNHIIEGSEQCDGEDMGEFSGKTCTDVNSSWLIGDLSCNSNYCQIDTSNCKKAIELILTPESGSIRRNRNFNTVLSVDGEDGRAFNLVASIKLKNAFTGNYEPTNNCKYILTGVYSSTFDLGNNSIPITNKTYSFNCKSSGDYMITFKGTLVDGTSSEDSSLWKITN